MNFETLKKSVNKFSSIVISFLESHKNEWIVFTLLVILGVSFYIFGPNLDANWWIVDDHEIMSYSYPKPLGFSNIIPTLLTKTEINPDSIYTRYRPLYYLFRLIETRLWGEVGPSGWYLLRLSVFFMFICILYLFFSNFNGRLMGFLLALMVTTFTFWSDVLSRLGPAEFYGIIGFSIFLIGILLLLRKNESVLSWLMMALGVVTLVGSKENLGIFILPFGLILILYLIQKPKQKLFPIVTFLISVAWCIWVYSNILFRIKLNNGLDFYENSLSITDRVSSLLNLNFNHWIIYIAVCFFFFIWVAGYLFIRKPLMKKLLTVSIFGSTFILILLISQDFFYSGSIWGRYNFPYSLSLPLLISLEAYLFLQFGKQFNKKILVYAIAVVGTLIVAGLMHPSNWHQIREESNQNVNRTHYFMSRLDSLALHLRKIPDTAVIIYGNDANSDYELTLSYSRFLRSRFVTNPIFILRDPPKDFEEEFEGLQLALEKRLVEYSKNGNLDWDVLPWSLYSINPSECVLITLKTDHSSPLTCKEVFDGDVMFHYSGLYEHR